MLSPQSVLFVRCTRSAHGVVGGPGDLAELTENRTLAGPKDTTFLPGTEGVAGVEQWHTVSDIARLC